MAEEDKKEVISLIKNRQRSETKNHRTDDRYGDGLGSAKAALRQFSRIELAELKETTHALIVYKKKDIVLDDEILFYDRPVVGFKAIPLDREDGEIPSTFGETEEDQRIIASLPWFYPINLQAHLDCLSLDVGDTIIVSIPKERSASPTDSLDNTYISGHKTIPKPVVTTNPNDGSSNTVSNPIQKFKDALSRFSEAAKEAVGFGGPDAGNFEQPAAAPTGTQNTVIVNDIEIETSGIKVKNYKNSSDAKEFKQNIKDRNPSKVRQFIIHETAGKGNATQLYDALIDRGLSVHFGLEADGTIFQYSDIATKTTFHAGNNNSFSIGLEIINPFDGEAVSPWEQSIKSPWSYNNSKKKYIVPTLEQCESTYKLILFITSKSGLDIPKTFLNFNEDVYRWGFLGKSDTSPVFADHKSPGIVSHYSILADNHYDGSFPILYSWLRDTKNMNPSRAFQKAKEISEDLFKYARVGEIQRDLKQYLTQENVVEQPATVSQEINQSEMPLPTEVTSEEEAVAIARSEPRNLPFLQFKKIEADFAKRVRNNTELGSKYFYVREDLYTPISEIKNIFKYYGVAFSIIPIEFDLNKKNISYLQRVGLQINLNKFAGLYKDGNILTDEYLVSPSKIYKNSNYYPLEVFARVFSNNKNHGSGINVYTGELDVLDISKSFVAKTNPEIKKIKGNFINLTQLFKKYNFNNVFPSKDFFVYSNYEKSNWWIFENYNGLIPQQTTLGSLLSKTYINNGEDIWKESNKIWNGKQFIG